MIELHTAPHGGDVAPGKRPCLPGQMFNRAGDGLRREQPQDHDEQQPGKWVFPEGTMLGPGERLVVFASGKDRLAPNLHTNFRLDSEGEYLALVEPDGATIHHQIAPTFPAQLPSVSYGLAPGGGGALGYFNVPTPLAENDADAVAHG